jgi:hypothetical protein
MRTDEKSRRQVLLGAVLGVAIAGCGGSANRAGTGGTGGGGGSASDGGVDGDAAVNGGSCPFAACGGNIVGTWHLASACGSISLSNCPPAQSIGVEHETSQATYTFASDGTFTNVISGAFSETYRYPFACLAILTDGGTAELCADLQNLAQASIAKADAGLSGATYACATDVNQACLCTETFTYPSPQTATGSYVVSGDQVTFSPSGGAAAGDAGAAAFVGYCVSGNTLTLQFTGGNLAGDHVMTLTR